MRLYTISEIGKELGHCPRNISWAISVGLLPPPDIFGPKRRYYSAKQYKNLKTKLSINDPDRVFSLHLTKSEILAQTALHRTLFDKLVDAGVLPQCDLYKGKRQLWAVSILDTVKDVMKERNSRPQQRFKLPTGYYNRGTAANALGCPKVTLNYWIDHCVVPAPSTRLEGVPYAVYVEKDLDRIREIKQDYFASN